MTLDGRTHVPGQGNNAYIFPGVGLGVIACGARHVTDEMFFAAAEALAHKVTEEDLATGFIYPPLSRIRSVSAVIAGAVAEVAWDQGLAQEPRPEDVVSFITSKMYEPRYTSYV